MLNYLNQLELQAKDHTHQLRQEAEAQHLLRKQQKNSWRLPIFRMYVPFKPVTEPQVKNCP
jgi:hypothetical protein